jgi:tRNA (guanine-N7-)-methyltransferase
MKPGARFFVMSDVQEAAEDMVRVLDESSAFSSWDGIWVDNPLPVATEREASCMSRGERIYRAVFERV